MKRILVTGARGYLASLARLYNTGTYEFLCISHTDVDFRDPAGVEDFFRAADFDVCLHMAADATTAHCEQDPEGTHRVNTESAIAIARACRNRGRRVVFISTEQCFNASPGEAPFSEEDEQASTSRYGQQKMEADAWIRENVEDYLILRFSWMFGLGMPGVHPSPNILTNVMRVLRTGEPAGFRVHERRNMTYAQRFAGQLPQILELRPVRTTLPARTGAPRTRPPASWPSGSAARRPRSTVSSSRTRSRMQTPLATSALRRTRFARWASSSARSRRTSTSACATSACCRDFDWREFC